MNLIISTILFIFIIGGLTFKFRNNLANIFKKIPLPNWVLFLIVATIYAIIEENINPPGGVWTTLLPFTIPIFIVFFIIHLLILKIFKINNFYIGVLIFGIWGWIAEFILGQSKTILWSAPLVTLIMTFWTILTYSVIIIVPVTILLEDKK